jgi:hypothetical protein
MKMMIYLNKRYAPRSVMSTRMQQRRGTAEQWTLANPILAEGEFGWESDTNSFKIGDGVNSWANLEYFQDDTALSGSLSDYVEVASLGVADGVATLDSTGNVPANQLANATVDLTGLATEAYADQAEADAITAANSYTDSEIATIPAVDLTGYATETYVDTAVSNLVDTAPETLDTLNELAAALGDDPNFATTVATQIGGKADAAHTHLIADVTNLQTTLDAKSPLAGSTSITTVGTVTNATSPTALGSKGLRNITISTSAPSGGASGDLWFTT